MLALYALDVLTLAREFGLISIDLLLLLGVDIFMALQLVADQSAGAETKGAADKSAGRGPLDRGANDTSGGCAAEGTDTRALFSGAESAAGATRKKHCQRHHARCQ